MPAGRLNDVDIAHLEHLRVTTGLTKQEIAAHTGVNTNVVTRWFNGTSSPSPHRALLLARCLNVDVLDLSRKTINTADIVDLRHRIGKTVQDVIDASDNSLSKTVLHNIERAIKAPAEEKLLTLSRIYDVNEYQIHRSWVNRRVRLFGRSSLELLTEDDRNRFKY
ncbi:helix-turn-helix domain-containing protein [Corynebacterium bovis]|uniref:helix-turn-helix domain-containing protein n=1 Tax=Corynebacterium bovis TaxID=36808 RepID=UPI003CC70DC3